MIPIGSNRRSCARTDRFTCVELPTQRRSSDPRRQGLSPIQRADPLAFQASLNNPQSQRDLGFCSSYLRAQRLRILIDCGFTHWSFLDSPPHDSQPKQLGSHLLYAPSSAYFLVVAELRIAMPKWARLPGDHRTQCGAGGVRM